MSHPLLVVCEAPGDFALAYRLIDRTIESHGPEWARDDLSAAREYFGIDPHREPSPERFIRWKNLGAVIDHAVAGEGGKARKLQLDTHQFGESFPDHEDAFAFLKLVRAVQTSDRVRQPDAFVLVRDTDSKDRTELRKLNDHSQFKKFPVVVGVPDPETECWVLAGFLHDATEQEQGRVDTIQRQVSVHPCRESHRLRASNEGDERHPKRVLSELTNDDGERIARCYDAPFDHLRANGASNGLTAFLDALEHRFIRGVYGGRVG